MRGLLLAAVCTVVAAPALAGPTCTNEPKEKWLTEAAMKAKIATLGYKYRVFKVTTGNCYEIYGQNESGQRTEVYFHPISGEIVEEHKS
jgi:hypothetical protein